jgi:hypothetical protein
VYNKPILISFAITYVLALLSAPVTTQTLREGCLHVRALFRPPEGSYPAPRPNIGADKKTYTDSALYRYYHPEIGQIGGHCPKIVISKIHYSNSAHYTTPCLRIGTKQKLCT